MLRLKQSNRPNSDEERSLRRREWRRKRRLDRKRRIAEMRKKRDGYRKRFSREERAEHQKEHLKLRIIERADVRGSFKDPDIFIFLLDSLVRSGDARLVGEHGGCYLYDVAIGDTWYRAVFDPETDTYRTIIKIEDQSTTSHGVG